MKIISLGLGVQSTALYYMSSLGELPRVDFAIFVDLGREKRKTYDYLEFLLNWQLENNGLPIAVVQRKNLFKDLLNSENSRGKRFSSIPAYTKGEDGEEGMLRRQCTGEYKIAQVDQLIRIIYGLQPRQRNIPTEIWKGISLDEIERLAIPQEAWKTQVYPFCGYETSLKKSNELLSWGRRMTRNDIEKWYTDHSLPIPPKSSCVFCPYTSDATWKKMKTEDPEDFADAVLVDRAIRDSSKKGINSPIFLHKSCRPLEEIDFPDKASDLWGGECSGECHT